MATSVTSLRNPIDDLVSKMGEAPEKAVGDIRQELTGTRQRGAKATEMMPDVLKTGIEGQETAMRNLQTQREKGAKDLGAMYESQAKDVEETEKRFAAMRPEPIEFAPSQETAENLQNIAISMMLVGAIAGGGSKRSGIAGLKAMKGMVDGYRQGRKDIFDKEKTIFEKALETQKMKLEEVKALYESAVKAQTAGHTAKANAYKAQLEAELAGGAMYVDIAKGRATAAQTLLDGAIAAGQKATEGIIKIDDAIEKRKLEREKMAQDAKFQQERLNLEKEKISKMGQKTATSALLAGRAENIREAFAQAAIDIVNITKFPPGTMLGALSGLTGSSGDTLVKGIRNSIARQISPVEQRMLQQLIAGIEGHLAFALGGGYATSQSKARMDQYKEQIAKAGDEPENAALFLARLKQEMNILADNFESKPGATQEMNNAVQKYNQQINDAVPFNVNDVIQATLSKRETKPDSESKPSGGWSIKEKK
jgi:hypothetical protein